MAPRLTSRIPDFGTGSKNHGVMVNGWPLYTSFLKFIQLPFWLVSPSLLARRALLSVLLTAESF